MAELLGGHVAVVTGAARGLGLAMARGFLAHGATVLLADVDAAALHEAAGSLTGPALPVGCDVTDEAAVEAVAALAAEHGGPDVWVNNAGVMRNGTFEELALADFRVLIDVHVQGSWLGTKHAARRMRAHGRGGSIVNISSIGGKAGLGGQTNYCAAKAAIVGLTKASAKELAPHGIRVNTILPGIIRTDMTAQLAADDLAARLTDVPLGRIGEPAEIADAAVFLASRMSSFVTGAALEVSGGRFM